METRNNSLDLDSSNNEEPILRNDSTVEEATKMLQDGNYSPLGENALFYVPYVAPVDEKPEHLIGVDSEDDVANDYDRLWLEVVAVGEDCKQLKVGDRVMIHPRFMATSVLQVPIENLLFGLFKESLGAVRHQR